MGAALKSKKKKKKKDWEILGLDDPNPSGSVFPDCLHLGAQLRGRGQKTRKGLRDFPQSMSVID